MILFSRWGTFYSASGTILKSWLFSNNCANRHPMFLKKTGCLHGYRKSEKPAFSDRQPETEVDIRPVK